MCMWWWGGRTFCKRRPAGTGGTTTPTVAFCTVSPGVALQTGLLATGGSPLGTVTSILMDNRLAEH